MTTKTAKTTEATIRKARIEWLSREMASIARWRGAAAKSKSWQAVAMFALRLQGLRGESDAAKLEEVKALDAFRVKSDARDRSPEEVMEEKRQDALALFDVHLEVYLNEWLRRNPGVHLATADGPITLLKTGT